MNKDQLEDMIAQERGLCVEFRRGLIFDVIDDLVSDFLYYDRKEDQEVPVGFIERAVQDGAITVEDLVDRWRHHMESKTW